MSGVIKLSKAQQFIIDKMNEGYKLRQWEGINGTVALVGQFTISVRISSVIKLYKQNLIRKERSFPISSWYLTEPAPPLSPAAKAASKSHPS